MGISALHYAVSENNIDIIRLLLERGADVNNHDNGLHEYPIHKAQSPEVIRLLKKYGADIHAPDRHGRTLRSETLVNYNLAVDYGNQNQARQLLNIINAIKSSQNWSKLKPFAVEAAKKSKLYSTWLLNNPNLPFGVDISEKIAIDIARGSQFGRRRKMGTLSSDIIYLSSL